MATFLDLYSSVPPVDGPCKYESPQTSYCECYDETDFKDFTGFDNAGRSRSHAGTDDKVHAKTGHFTMVLDMLWAEHVGDFDDLRPKRGPDKTKAYFFLVSLCVFSFDRCNPDWEFSCFRFSAGFTWPQLRETQIFFTLPRLARFLSSASVQDANQFFIASRPRLTKYTGRTDSNTITTVSSFKRTVSRRACYKLPVAMLSDLLLFSQ